MASDPEHPETERTLVNPRDRSNGGADVVPDRIGPYRILEALGEGGMGTVYEAEQSEPVRRRVAIKVIKPGMDSKRVLARFELERRALAAMNHSCIAKVFDCGATERGQPYFVMELVDGLALTDYCDKHCLSLRDRINLFQRVCTGVQHAHQKGVIHRDLKPGNILVVQEGDRPVPKLLDFGLAKATNSELSTETAHTEHEQILGTPEYMAPEQAARDHAAIDTRADIYSLGVTLYELLCGELPFPRRTLRKGGSREMVRVLVEEEPPKPSTKLSTSGDRASEFARVRRTPPGTLARRLRGELDWIVLKAMAKEPERRYDSATGLAMDLQRHLDHDPVEAGPPSAAYRLRKLLRRYRGQVVTASILLLVLCGGIVGTTWGFVRAEERADEIGRQKQEIERTATALAARTEEFDLLSMVVHLEAARAEEKRLYPPFPNLVPHMRRWLEEDVQRLRDGLPKARTTVQALRSRSTLTPEEAEALRRTHRSYPDVARLRKRLAAVRRGMKVADGEIGAASFVLDPAVTEKGAKELNDMGWPLVDPKREEYGREAEGLAILRLAHSKASRRGKAIVGRSLAWALFANGLDDEGVAAAQAAADAAPARERKECEKQIRDLARTIDSTRSKKGRSLLALAERELDDLEVDITEWRFPHPSDDFLHETLTKLVRQIEAFEREEVKQLERQLWWAERVEKLTIDRFAAEWADACEAVAKADGVVASDSYAERPLDLTPQMGLVPIGMNPKTKLWEFYHLRSAWDPASGSDPAELEIPAHREDGSIDVRADTGIVFVLLPGGRFAMGAQASDVDGRNYDPDASANESPVHDVTLRAFFLARHEMTQAQWRRLSGGERPSYSIGRLREGEPIPVSEREPVDNVDWQMCHDLLERYGLELPTEAQWEYGARAGTTTHWFVGADAELLAGYANVMDQSGLRAHKAYRGEGVGFDDGHAGPAPVGSFKANPWGLFDVHGNVWEWCADRFAGYHRDVRRKDGMREGTRGTEFRPRRGGSCHVPASYGRSAERASSSLTVRGNDLGLRVARSPRR